MEHLMPNFIQKYATPLTTGLFLVSLISGVALFFHLGGRTFHAMHEWLSMVLILPLILHLWKNWRPLVLYFGRLPMTIALVLSAGAALAFAFPSDQGKAGGPPQVAFARALAKASPSALAPALGLSADDLVARLKERGFAAAEPTKPLSAIAAASGKNERDLIIALTPAK